MGGGQALTIGLNNLDLFSHVAGFSSGLGDVANFPKLRRCCFGDV
jgi:enterochelin esterase-like enzyme